MSKTLKIIFTISILLNLLMAGVIIGHAAKKWKESDWYEVKDQLQPETRELMRQAFRSGFKEVRPLFREARQKRNELSQILSAEEFDGQAYDRVSEDLMDIESRMFAHRYGVVKDISEQLPAAERKILVKKFVSGFLDRRGSKHHHKGKKHWKDKRDEQVREELRDDDGKPVIIMPREPEGKSVPEEIEEGRPDFTVPEQVPDEVLQDNIIKDPADMEE